MDIISRHYKLLALLVACFCFAGVASAGVIAFRPGDGTSELSLGGADVDGLSENALAVSWVQAVEFQNVFIDVFNLRNLDSSVEADTTVNFYLRTGSLVGPLVGQGSVSVLPGQTSDGQPFSGLTLPAATYFLIASAPGFEGAWLGDGSAWSTDYAGQVTLGTESLRNSENLGFTGEFTPLGLGYNVEFVDESAVPEPGTWLLLGTGLLGLAGVLRRRRS